MRMLDEAVEITSSYEILATTIQGLQMDSKHRVGIIRELSV